MRPCGVPLFSIPWMWRTSRYSKVKSVNLFHFSLFTHLTRLLIPLFSCFINISLNLFFIFFFFFQIKMIVLCCQICSQTSWTSFPKLPATRCELPFQPPAFCHPSPARTQIPCLLPRILNPKGFSNIQRVLCFLWKLQKTKKKSNKTLNLWPVCFQSI